MSASKISFVVVGVMGVLAAGQPDAFGPAPLTDWTLKGVDVSDPVAVVRTRYRQSLLLPKSAVSSANATVTPWVHTLDPTTCMWPDVNYTDKGRALWLTSDHMTRVVLMTKVWASTTSAHGSKAQNQDGLLKAILCATQTWVQRDWQNPNWWFNDIGIPTMFGNTFLLLGPTLVPSATATAAIKIFDRADPPKPMTGANLVWETQITLMHSLFTNNATVVARCFATIFASAQVMPQPAEGIMVDGSFHQHGAELLAGSYGAAFTSCSLELLAFASGTPFYMTPAQCDAFSLLVLDGQSWMITPKTPMLDWSVIGREISRNPGVTKANFLPDQLRNVSCSRHVEFAALAARLDPNDSGGVPLVGHRHFYDSDYTVARSSGGKWTASVRMYSKRTVNARCVNREGVQDEHTADGVLNVYQDGTEYYKVPPVWDYMRLPGTVIRQAGRRPSCGTTVQSSPCEFVGGVSGGQLTTGTSAQQLVSRGLQQLRSWFFFDTAIVALASNMSLTNPADPTPESPVIMTLAAQALDGNVVIKLVGNDTPLTLPSGNRTYPAKHVEWILHKRLAYVCTPMPCGGEVEVVNMPVAGNWNTLGAQSGEVHTPLFSATVNLGPSPIVANMHLPPTGYIVFPESTVDTILHSLSLLDVVSDPAHLAVGAVLRTSSLTTFAGGVFPSSTGGVLDFGGLTVGVNAPSMVQYMDLANRTVVVAASSPTASTQVVAITVTTTLVCSTNDRVYLTSSSTAGTTLHMNLTAVAPGATVEARCTLQ